MSNSTTLLEYYFERTRKAGDDIMRHTHEGVEIVYYRTGSGQVVVGNDIFRYHGGNYCIIPATVPHDEHASEETALTCAVFSTDTAVTSGLYTDTDGKVLTCLSFIGDEQKKRQNGGGAIISNSLQIILTLTERLLPNAPDESYSPDPMFEAALTYIRDYYNTDIDMKELASVTGYSYDRFRHLFRERYGIPPGRFLMLTRLDAAKQMLRDRSLSSVGIKTIALSNGFSSYTRFCSAFCKEQGMTPGEYRRVNSGQPAKVTN